jgi:tetratricopeptide (TPR) repeat protein
VMIAIGRTHRSCVRRRASRLGTRSLDALAVSLLLAALASPLLADNAPQQSPPASPPSESAALTPEQRADICMARKNFGDAADYYRRALRQTGESTPAAAALWNKLGIAYQQQAYLHNAEQAYKRALKVNKQFGEAWNNLGTVYFLQGKAKKSLKEYRHAIQLNPDSASFHLNLGTSYSRLKKYPEAFGEYRTALTLDPNILMKGGGAGTVMETRAVDVEYYFYMAKVFASLGRPDEAIRYLRHAFEDGFKNLKRLDDDPDFVKISKDPAYIALRQNPPIAIKD